MNSNIIQKRLDEYQCKTLLDEKNALKEITQEIALLSLSKANFFKEAEFHGGTALRILHNLQRFSEDLDFALLKPNPAFSLNHYLEHMAQEFELFNYTIHISDRATVEKTVQKQFLKVDSIGKELILQYPLNKSHQKIKIKFEVDTNPPSGATTEIHYLSFPVGFSVLAKDLPSSFAGKLHALLCRKYIKGRDWYDFIWYVTHKTQINFNLLSHALMQQGPWQNQKLNVDFKWLNDSLKEKIKSIDWNEAKNDLRPLIKPYEIASLDLWQEDFFLSLLKKMNDYLTR